MKVFFFHSNHFSIEIIKRMNHSIQINIFFLQNIDPHLMVKKSLHMILKIMSNWLVTVLIRFDHLNHPGIGSSSNRSNRRSNWWVIWIGQFPPNKRYCFDASDIEFWFYINSFLTFPSFPATLAIASLPPPPPPSIILFI